LTGFYDYGWLKVMQNNLTATNPNQYELQGFGASLGWQASQAVVAKATLAQRIGHNVTPLDTDGTKTVTRLWFNTSISF
jgi:4-diphosphocytidyl-2C-methyl-D-erythritol kinase